MNMLIALVLTLTGVWISKAIFECRTPGIALIIVYLLLYFIMERIRRPASMARYVDEPKPDYSSWPTSGPIGRLGQSGLIAMWTWTNTLAILNPFQARQIVQQIVGNSTLKARERRNNDDGSSYKTQIEYSLPFEGEWFVYNGGMTPKTSHSWHVLGQRYALDFVVIDGRKRRHAGRGTRAEEYFCYGQKILAAADGEVIGVEDGIGLAPLLGWGICDFTARSFIGNYVLIRHSTNEYALYAHLIKEKVAVRPGDQVIRRQTIGYCGHTGHSSEPHLHFHVQDSPDIFKGMGRPVRFASLMINDKVVLGDVCLTAGNRVRFISDN